MYFPSPTDVPPMRFRAPKFTNSFPRLTSLSQNLMFGEEGGCDLPFSIRLGHVVASSQPPHKTELALRRRGKYSGRLSFSTTTPSRSRFLFALNGFGRMEGELFRTYAGSADEDTPLEPGEEAPHEEDGRGIRWAYEPSSETSGEPLASYVDFFWDRSYHSSKDNYLRGGFVIGGMLPGSLLPFAVDTGGIDLGTTLLAARGPWAVGMDCQLRCVWFDLCGGRCHLNSVLAYQKPTFGLTLNMHEFGERFISSAVANPVGLYKALTKSAHVDNNQDLYNCTWLVGAEADIQQRNGTYHTDRLSFGLTRRNSRPFPYPQEEGGQEVFKVADPLLTSGEGRVKLDVLNQGVGNVAYRLSLHYSALVPVGAHVRLAGSVQTDLPLNPDTARVGLSLTFVV